MLPMEIQVYVSFRYFHANQTGIPFLFSHILADCWELDANVYESSLNEFIQQNVLSLMEHVYEQIPQRVDCQLAF
jgi:hypothetical protein